VGEGIRHTVEQIQQFSDFFKEVDPYDHPVVVHTDGTRAGQEATYNGLLGFPTVGGASLHSNEVEDNFEDVLYWIQQSATADHKWVVSNDEQGPSHNGVLPDLNDTERNSIRINSLWGTIMAGGAYVHL